MPYIVPAYNPDPRVKPQFPCAVDWNHSLSKGLVGCWLFNEMSGKVCNDLVFGYPALFQGSLNWYSDSLGPFNDNDFLHAGDQSIYDFGNSDFTIVVKCRTGSSYGVYPSFVSKGDWDVSGWYFNSGNLFPSDAGHHPAFSCRIAGVMKWARARGVNEPDYFSLNKNYMPCVVIKQGSPITLYNNGMPCYDYENRDTVSGTIEANALNLTFGRSANAIGQGFPGYLKTIYIFNRALTPSEIQQLYLEPYCFIRPAVPHPYWIPDAAPAAGVPTHMDYYRRMRNR